MARNDPQVNFRIPADLRDRIVAASQESGRTLTAEVVHRLERSFAPPASKTEMRASPVVLEIFQDGLVSLAKQGLIAVTEHGLNEAARISASKKDTE